MPMPRSRDARLYYRCAMQRFEDAKVLQVAGDRHSTGAVYLAGYSVECIVKAAILNEVSSRRRGAVLRTFSGSHAHDYEWLRTIYLTNGGARFPRQINRHFTLVSNWSTELRYNPKSVGGDEARSFLESAGAIIAWADGRL